MPAPDRVRLLAVLAGVLLGTVGGGPAAASVPSDPAARLVSSDPAAEAALPVAPAAVRLTFATPPRPGRCHVSVVDGSGAVVSVGEPAVGPGPALTQRISVTGPGDLTVAYHVEWDDGQDTAGTFRFSVGTGVPPAPAAVSGRTVDGLIDSPAGTDPEADHGHGHGVDPASAVLLIIDGLAVMIALGLLFRRRPDLVDPADPADVAAPAAGSDQAEPGRAGGGHGIAPSRSATRTRTRSRHTS